MNPGTSIVNHASLPGILSLLIREVFPAPYQGIAHCSRVICYCQVLRILYENQKTYHREECEELDYQLPILPRRRQPVLDECHTVGLNCTVLRARRKKKEAIRTSLLLLCDSCEIASMSSFVVGPPVATCTRLFNHPLQLNFPPQLNTLRIQISHLS